MMKKILLATLLAAACACSPKYRDAVIPQPRHVEVLEGSCRTGQVPLFLTDGTLPSEAYTLAAGPDGIIITASDPAGEFYARQTLAQLERAYGRRMPSLRIEDSPRFEYRGVHLDLSRHFQGIDFVKKQLRLLASLKINRLHLHLVDGAGWRMQIGAYPLLTEVAAWRPECDYGLWGQNGKHFCRESRPGAYGGYYTEEQLRGLVAFADSLHITIIPEIEMFGHSEEVTAVYPDLGCRNPESSAPLGGGPDTEALRHGNDSDTLWTAGSGDLCIGSEATFEFLETVLDAVMRVFPSEYIHIGGDEASKQAWSSCPRCRERIRSEHLSGVDGLQSYGIGRIAAFVSSRGRKIIGWDDILDGDCTEGGFAESWRGDAGGELSGSVAVMSWRGVSGGEAAAKAGHEVIMTPGDYCYLDKCQGDPATEPAGFGGSLTLRKVYSYDPAPSDMPGRECVMGVQGNLWTEMVTTPEHVEHMYYPRVYALAEVAWTDPEIKDFDSFFRRACEFNRQAVRDGYHPFDLKHYKDNREGYDDNHRSLAEGAEVQYVTPYYPGYAAGGDGAMTDGLTGGWDFRDRWQGWLNNDAVFTVDLGESRSFGSLSISFIQERSAEIMLPERVDFEVSEDGINFSPLGSDMAVLDWTADRPVYRAFVWRGRGAGRFVRVSARINEQHWGWLFADELLVR